MQWLLDILYILKDIANKISLKFKSDKGKNILFYLVFVAISFIFWLMLTLNNQVQEVYEVDVKLSNIPDSVTFINDLPPIVKVTVKDKGSTFLKYSLGSRPVVKLNFDEYLSGNGRFSVTPIDLHSKIAENFGSGVEFISVSPDSLCASFTASPGKLVPVVLDVIAEPNYKYVINGKIQSSNDSVYIYSNRGNLAKISFVKSSHIEEFDLKDSISINVPLVKISGVKTVPSSVKVNIPVEPLISKRASFPVTILGCPEGVSVVTFPSKLNLRYLVPASSYNAKQPFTVNCFYNDVNSSKSKLKVYVDNNNWEFGDITLDTDSVEYIIENI